MTKPPKSPGLTAVLPNQSFGAKTDGAGYSAVAVHAASRRWLSFFLALSLLAVLSGCKQQHTIAGDYRLEQFEDGHTYYLHKLGHDDSADGGSIIGGTVLQLGWNSRFIVAERHSIYRGDPDGWMIINVQTGSMSGPFTEADLRKHSEASDIRIYEVSEAWKRL